MKWTKSGGRYADISLPQMMDKSCFLKVQQFERGYHRKLTLQKFFEKLDFLDTIVIL